MTLTVVPTVIEYTTKVKHDGVVHELHFPALEIPRCQTCGETYSTTAVDEQISDALRSKLRLLTPAQIRQGIETLGLKQQELAERLGVAPETISRWVNGALIQSRAMDNFLRAYFAIPEMQTALRGREQDPNLGTPAVAERNGSPKKVPPMNRLFSAEDQAIGEIHDQLGHLLTIKSQMLPAAGSVQTLTRTQLSVLIETAFWASLRSNEARTTRFYVTVAAPENFSGAVAFATPIAYDESQIAKLAPAVPIGGCLLVSGSSDGLCIWGFGRSRSGTWGDTVTVEVSEPGTVRVGVGPFQPFAVLTGRSNSMIAGTRTNLAHYLQRVLRKALPADDFLETQAVWRECLALRDLARMIVAHGHGGIILIVPSEVGEWSRSLNPFEYRFAVPDTTIHDALRSELKDGNARGKMLQQLWAMDMPDDLKTLVTKSLAERPSENGQGLQATASLAGVDGAIVVTRDLRVLGFGAKIAVESGTLLHVSIFRPEPGTQEVIPSPLEDVGGTRHQSAARFIAANRDAVALVVSQDCHLSVVHWDESINSVAVVRNAEWWL